ncbi:MAG: hypothetical protein PHE73_08585 [Sulfurovaceae bacterium]|nr:hypothetical protein [Sulfurovaceae bacterium]
MKKQITELMQISDVSYYRWKKSPKQKDKKEAPKIFSLLEYAFSEQELDEYLSSGKIEKLELIKDIDIEELKTLIKNKDLLHKVTEIKSLLEDK